MLRLTDVLSARQADVILIQREAMIFGPPLVEWLIAPVLKRPMVLDLDDATYVAYSSPTYGGLGKALKWFSKTEDLIKWAGVVTCGNRSIAEYVSSKGARARVIPTVVDTSIFRPAPQGLPAQLFEAGAALPGIRATRRSRRARTPRTVR